MNNQTDGFLPSNLVRKNLIIFTIVIIKIIGAFFSYFMQETFVNIFLYECINISKTFYTEENFE